LDVFCGEPEVQEKKALDQLVDATVAFWQPRSGRSLSREDAREMVASLRRFFQTLRDWEAAERAGPQTETAIGSRPAE
jgi:hypothetical protein